MRLSEGVSARNIVHSYGNNGNLLRGNSFTPFIILGRLILAARWIGMACDLLVSNVHDPEFRYADLGV